MAHFKVETTAQVRRVYIIEAESVAAAWAAVMEGGGSLDHEEDITEEVGPVEETASD